MKSIEDIEVKDRQSFIEFLQVFQMGLTSDSEKWKNKNLNDFLEAMTRYAEDIQGYYNNHPTAHGESMNADIPSWQTFADILKGARIYE